MISLAYWVLGQAFGGITTGMATDLNAGLLFVLLALALFPTAVEGSSGVGRFAEAAMPALSAGKLRESGPVFPNPERFLSLLDHTHPYPGRQSVNV